MVSNIGCILQHCVDLMANVIAKVADGIVTKGLFYFNLSSEVLNRTLSHMCGRWYLPMFLLRDWLLTLMYNAPLMVLMRFWSSFPFRLKFSIVTVWPVVLEWSYIWKGAFGVLWTSHQKFLKIPQCILHHTPPCHIYICIWLHSF